MTTVKRRDKKMLCNDCCHEFWADASLSIRQIWCPHCNSFHVSLAREDGKPVIKDREYQTGEVDNAS